MIERLFWIFGYYVPSVEEAGNVAEAAEGDIDEGIGGANAALHPD